MEGHWQREEDARLTWLLCVRRLWVIPAAALLGAVLCGLVYTGVIATVRGAKQYRQTARYYLDFAYNDQTQKAYDYFNAATWDVLLFTHPGIFEVIEENLPEDMTLAEASDAAFADIYSDIRVLSVEVTTSSPERTRAVTEAVRLGLESFGTTAKEFTAITFLSAEEPALVIVSDRTRNAVLLGLVLGGVAAALLLWLACLMDDGLYVPEEAEQRFGVPVLGVIGTDIPDFLGKEAAANLGAVSGTVSGGGEILVIGGLGKETAKESGFGEAHGLARARFLDAGADPALAGAGPAGAEALVLVPFGRGGGRRLRNLLSQASKREIRVKGLVVTGADGRFLRKYYG